MIISLVILLSLSFTECKRVVNKPVLPNNTHCYISPSCTAFKCCQDVTVLSSTLESSIELDPCNFILKIRIEKLMFEIRYFDFEWGEYGVLQNSLNGVDLAERDQEVITKNVMFMGSFHNARAVITHFMFIV